MTTKTNRDKAKPQVERTDRTNGDKGNGTELHELVGLVKNLVQSQEAAAARMDEIEEKVETGSPDAAKLRLVNLLFDTDDKRVMELAKISPLAVRPFAAAMTLEAIGDPKVKSGEVSLSKLYMINLLRLGRSSKAWYFMAGIPALQEQVTAEVENKTAEFDMGKEA